MYSFKQRERQFPKHETKRLLFHQFVWKEAFTSFCYFSFCLLFVFYYKFVWLFEKLVIYFFILNKRANINQYSPKDATYFSLVLNKCIAGAPSFAEDMFSKCVLLCLSLSLIVFSLLLGKIDIDCAFALETKQPFTLHMQVPQLATM